MRIVMTGYTVFICRVSKCSFNFKGNIWNSSTIASHQFSHGLREDYCYQCTNIWNSSTIGFHQSSHGVREDNKKEETESIVLGYVLNFNHTVIQSVMLFNQLVMYMC